MYYHLRPLYSFVRDSNRGAEVERRNEHGHQKPAHKTIEILRVLRKYINAAYIII